MASPADNRPDGVPGTRKRVVVLGGGFGGLSAVRAMRKLDAEIILVDRHAYNTFQPLLYQVATAGLNPGDITYFLRSRHARQQNMRFIKGDVLGVDPLARRVDLDQGLSVDYDYLVVATGVTTNYFGVPGAEEHALALYTRAQALAVRDKMFTDLERAARQHQPHDLRVVVVGGGATGVEMAGSLAELRNQSAAALYPELDTDRMHITLVEMAPQLLSPFPARSQRYARRALEKRGVQLLLSTTVKEVRPDGVVVDDGEFIEAGMVIWASGIKVPEMVGEWGLPQGRAGRIDVGPDLRVKGFDNIFAVGDIAISPEVLPQLAQPALQGGKHVGKQIGRLLEGEETEAFRYFDEGILATIGRSSAVAKIPYLPPINGFPAWLIWLFVHIMYLLGNRNRFATIANLSVRYLSWSRSHNAIVGEVETPTQPRADQPVVDADAPSEHRVAAG
ncbi:MAG TPA: NAD(P)/FAD-dependent oxidoreductase [Nocardioidaceae bacterium]|jgi:NADH dehydrogenase|nr:NAD(P)/FAD-dependent oxidoreductase [Nocardioidaceae bacterium]